ncbi:MAG: DUF2895 family protein [Gammaproteobacteria bacterium]|nr:DUF2895 family protein [Gammaproteobacteria bacterium]
MQPKNKNEDYKQDIRIRNRVIFILLMMLSYALFKFANYPNQLSIHTAPDISKSFVQKVGDVPLQTVYGFSRTIWETMQYCVDDCAKEYKENLNNYRNFLTPACYQELNDHFDNNQQLYTMRSRRLLPTEESGFSTERVKKVADGLWYVYQQYLLEDDIGGIKTRKQIMEYPLKIISSSSPTINNPWGLEIDCFWDDIRVVEYKELKEID